MSVQQSMNEWGRKYLRSRGYDVADDANITFDDRMESDGYCETCYHDYYVVDVSDGIHTHTYYGDMGDLLREMNGMGY